MFTYDANGNQLTSTTTQTAADGTVRTLTTRTDYDAEGRSHYCHRRRGWHHAYRVRCGREQRRPRSMRWAGALNSVTTSGTSSSRPSSPTPRPLTRRTIPAQRAEYDAAGREIARIDELGRRTEYAYDAAGRLIKTIYPDATPADPLDNPCTQTEYDAAGQVTAQIDERGNRTEFGYDAAGRQSIRPRRAGQRDDEQLRRRRPTGWR